MHLRKPPVFLPTAFRVIFEVGAVVVPTSIIFARRKLHHVGIRNDPPSRQSPRLTSPLFGRKESSTSGTPRRVVVDDDPPLGAEAREVSTRSTTASIPRARPRGRYRGLQSQTPVSTTALTASAERRPAELVCANNAEVVDYPPESGGGTFGEIEPASSWPPYLSISTSGLFRG